jgi:hypothetical protein
VTESHSGASDVLYVVAECPACPGVGGVVVLKSEVSGALVFFAPCCGTAWPEPPFDGRLDEIHSIEEIAPGRVEVATPADLRANNLELLVIRTEPLQRWEVDLPTAPGPRKAIRSP